MLDRDPMVHHGVERLIVEHLPLARSVGRAFAPTPALADDCEQVACLGLVLAARRYDPARGVPLGAFARPTMLGELKRYLRDTGWWVRPPRRLQELALQVRAAEEQLRQELGREPGEEDLVAALGVTPSELREARSAARGMVAAPEEETHHHPASEAEEALTHVDDWVTVHPFISALEQEDREMLHLRYLEGESQESIAQRLGISQPQVSRRIRRVLETLRGQVSG